MNKFPVLTHPLGRTQREHRENHWTQNCEISSRDYLTQNYTCNVTGDWELKFWFGDAFSKSKACPFVTRRRKATEIWQWLHSRVAPQLQTKTKMTSHTKCVLMAVPTKELLGHFWTHTNVINVSSLPLLSILIQKLKSLHRKIWFILLMKK